MKKKHMIIKLPDEKVNLDTIISDDKHDVKHVAFSSVVVNGTVEHYVFVLWHDAEYGDHMF
ncbi:hypothetical protein JXA80_11830 [bacterium]|nr:hypothetical protein [candidate division CSSED10-310 bacterium]